MSSSEIEKQADRAAAAGDAASAARLLERLAAENGERFELWLKLSAMRRATGDLPGALAAIDRALAIDPLDLAALLSRAFLLERTGDARAGKAFAIAAAQAPDEPPPALTQALEHARRQARTHQRSTEERLLKAIPSGMSAAARERVQRFISNNSRRTRHFHQNPTDFHYPAMPEAEFHAPKQFGNLDLLESRTAEIRSEFEALIAAEAAEMVPYIQYPAQVPLRQWKELNRNPRWSAIHLLQNGLRVEANARHCPKTMEILGALDQPDVPGASPNAMFSLLAPRTRIPPHTGVANTRLICHLPLIVPPDCGFRVGGTTVDWTPGKAFVFDDTIEHEAWNDSDELRVVLILDLWPPALGPEERDAIARIIPAAGVAFTGNI